jgi:hypothetical protein
VTVMLDCAISGKRHGKFTETGVHAATFDVWRRRASSEAASSREMVPGCRHPLLSPAAHVELLWSFSMHSDRTLVIAMSFTNGVVNSLVSGLSRRSSGTRTRSLLLQDFTRLLRKTL